ncbi:Uncharacterised protein [Candidatus Anstonella stagnisolia]|nr:Uncharacterised protein [Candidatus Anstonella stagnisolia]
MRREDPLYDSLMDAPAKRGKAMKPKDVMRLKEQLRHLPEEPEVSQTIKAQGSNGKVQKPVAAKEEQPASQKKDPSIPDFTFTEREFALIEELSTQPLPNTVGLTDKGYMQRLLDAIDAMEGAPSESGMRDKARVDYTAYEKFLVRNPEMEALLKKRRLGKLNELPQQQIFHYRIGQGEQWLKDAVNERKRFFILGALNVEGGKSVLSKFPTTGAIEAHLGMTGKSLSDFVAAPPEWKAQFQQAMILWAQTAPEKDFLTGLKFGELDDYIVPACALRFTDLQVAAIRELERVPSDTSIAEKMTEKYGVNVPVNTIVMHRKWLEENGKKRKVYREQIEQIEQAKLELMRGGEAAKAQEWNSAKRKRKTLACLRQAYPKP